MALDIIICSIPRMSVYYPPAAPAILKSCVNRAGYSCTTIDFVVRFHNKFFNTPLWERIDNWLVVPGISDPEVFDLIKAEVEAWAKDMISLNPKWIGISVFSTESHKITKLLCIAIKKFSDDVKIVLGGMGITDDANMFASNLKFQGLCDEFLLGDGEEAIVNLLNKTVEKNKFHMLTDLDQFPYADWSDYNLNDYKATKKVANELRKEDKKTIWQGYGNSWYRTDEILTLPIVGSRGCVRACSFCDIPSLWPKYQTRSAENIAQEIILNYEKYNVQRFHFTDSLMNGNMKNFRRLCEILADYREKNDADFTMTGQFIIRTHSSETDHDYEMMSRAGFKILEVGIESGSEAVRWHMGKKFTNRDIDVFMERIHKHGIMAVFLLIVGYPTETEQDFQDTLDMLTRYLPYRKSGTVLETVLGGTLKIENNTKLEKDPDVIFHPTATAARDDLHWTYKSNPELTLKERIRRRLEILEHAQNLGYMAPSNSQEMLYLKFKWQELKDKKIA